MKKQKHPLTDSQMNLHENFATAYPAMIQDFENMPANAMSLTSTVVYQTTCTV